MTLQSNYPHPETCSVCGKFIGGGEFDRDEIDVEFTPDTEFTTEDFVFTHKACLKSAQG